MILDIYIKLIENLNEKDILIYFCRLEDIMERYRKNGENKEIIDEFNEKSKPFLISENLWKIEEYDSENEELSIDSYISENFKTNYSRFNHFIESMKKYQGKNKINLNKNKIKELTDLIFLFFPDKNEITRSDIISIFKTYSINIKGFENALYYHITKKYIDDLSEIETKILEVFKKFSKEYDELKKNEKNRKKFLYSQYVLYHLLKKNNHIFELKNFTMIKTEERKNKHDKICKKIFNNLNWKFIN